MIVTKFHYPLEKTYLEKLDLMIERCVTKKSKKDAVLIFEGNEGEGKTTFSVATGYYVAEKTGRHFGADCLFFNLREMIDFAKQTENKIIIWDEPALEALSTDSRKRVATDLTRLLMMARKKRHFIMINMAKFYKFSEYVIVDRPLALIHVYSRKNIISGRFLYIRKKNLEPLYLDWKYKKRRNYKKYAHPTVRGSFPDVLNPTYENNVLSEFDVESYEKRKDAAIDSIGSKETINYWKEKLIKLKWGIYQMPGTQEEKRKCFKVSTKTISNWGRLPKKYPELNLKPYKKEKEKEEN